MNLLVVIFVLCALFPAVNAQSTPAVRLTEPSQVIAVDGGFTAEHLAVRKWERGYLLGYDIDNAIVMAVDRSGKLVLNAKVSPSDASHVILYDVSASPSGTFAVALSGVSPGGGPSGFIALLDHFGRTAQLVQVASGAPYLVCYADDGSIWAAVRAWDPNSPSLMEASSYNILRHYDAAGRLIGSAVSRRLFPSGRFPGELGSLSASRDRIGLFASYSRTWVEVSSDGTTSQPIVLPGAKADLARAFLSPSNEVLIHQQERAEGGKGALRGYRLERASNNLTQMDQTAIDSSGATLIGVDGQQFVYLTSHNPFLLKWSSSDGSTGAARR